MNLPTSKAARASLLLGLVVVLASSPLPAQADRSVSQRVRTVITARLPAHMNGDKLRATVLAVQYGPGEASSQHTHACPVIVYVLEGKVRSQVAGQPETIYRAGESFYELPGKLHQVSANASNSSPARFLAFFLCDRDVPLSSDAARTRSGAAQ